MAEFTYNNTKNASPSHILIKLNYSYHFCAFYEKDINSRSQLKLIKEPSNKLRNFMIAYREIF